MFYVAVAGVVPLTLQVMCIALSSWKPSRHHPVVVVVIGFAALPADVTDAPNCYPKGPVEIDASGAALSRVPMLYPDEAGVWKFGAEAAAVVAASAAPSISPK